MARQYTNKLLDMIAEGLLETEAVLLACLKYMSEDDVKDMMHFHKFIEDEGE